MMRESEHLCRERLDFSKIKTGLSDARPAGHPGGSSYAEFLQMELLPEERKDTGLQAAFKDVFPISDFKETTQLDFISYSIGNWECKCGRLKGVENSRAKCTACGTLLPADVELTEKEVCPYCCAVRKIEVPALRPLRRPGRPEDEVQPERVPPEGLHLRRPAAPQGPADLLGKGRDDQDQAAQAHQGAGGLFRRHPPDDRQGDVHLQRHRAGRRQPAAALAGRLLPPGRGQGLLHRQDHPLPGRLGRVRVRHQEQPLRPPGPEEEIPGHGLPPGPGLQLRRGHPQALPPRLPGRPRRAASCTGTWPTGLAGKTAAEDVKHPKTGAVLVHARKKITAEILARDAATPAWPAWPSTARTCRAPTPWPASRARSRRRGDRRHGPRPPHRQGRAVRGLLPDRGRRPA